MIDDKAVEAVAEVDPVLVKPEPLPVPVEPIDPIDDIAPSYPGSIAEVAIDGDTVRVVVQPDEKHQRCYRAMSLRVHEGVLSDSSGNTLRLPNAKQFIVALDQLRKQIDVAVSAANSAGMLWP